MKYKYNNEWKDLTVKAGDTLPIGTIVPFGGNNIPSNWLVCDGTAISRTTYADLFSAIGTSFGEGDGSTTFNLPDLRSRVPLGKDSRDEDFDTIGSNYGEKEHTLTVDEIPTTYAKAPTSTSGGSIAYFRSEVIAGYNGSGAGSAIATITGGDQSHNIVQPSLVTNYIIKAFQSVGAVGKVLNSYTENNVDTYSCNYINSMDAYSTSETKTNKVWIDGKPIYRKVIIGTTTIASGNYTVAHDISNLGDIVDFKYYSWQNSTTMSIGSTSPLDDSDKLSVYINGNNITVRNSWESIKRVIIIEYTKTTD